MLDNSKLYTQEEAERIYNHYAVVIPDGNGSRSVILAQDFKELFGEKILEYERECKSVFRFCYRDFAVEYLTSGAFMHNIAVKNLAIMLREQKAVGRKRGEVIKFPLLKAE